MGHVKAGGFLGHDDYEMLEFKVLSVMRKKNSRVATLDFRRVNLKLLRESFSRVPWKFAFECLGVHKFWSALKNHILEHRSRQFHCVIGQASEAEDQLG